MHFSADVLLASIDDALASVKAVLAAADDPEQMDEARTFLAGRAGANIGRLPGDPGDGAWYGVPAEVFAAIGRARQAAIDGDIDAALRFLLAAREMLGGRSA